MRVLVTGAKGMMGSDLCPVLREHHRVLATDIEEMDVRDRELVQRITRDFMPDVVMHLAALTNVDYCEQRPDEAFRTNTIGTQNVALACQDVGATMVYISTISVFDGLKPTPYTEFDRPNPQSYYSRAKYEGERLVQSLLSQYYIVRAGWMFGGGPEDKKFVAKIIDLACSRPELKVVDDKFGSPTYTLDISRGISHLVDTGLYGVYHMVNANGCVSRYELARAILDSAGITGCRIIPVSSAEFPLPAPRPRMEAARNYHLDLRGMPLMRDWRSALRSYLERLYVLGEQRIALVVEPVHLPSLAAA
jgi:dTDP-4-dehydrorhamnose reductase